MKRNSMHVSVSFWSIAASEPVKSLKIESEVHVGPRTSFSRFSAFKKDMNEGEASAYFAMPNGDTLPWVFLICSLYYNHFFFFLEGGLFWLLKESFHLRTR